jgi:hypothetical protein
MAWWEAAEKFMASFVWLVLLTEYYYDIIKEDMFEKSYSRMGEKLSAFKVLVWKFEWKK